MDQNVRTMDWNVPITDQNLRTIDRNVTTIYQNLGGIDFYDPTMGRDLSYALYWLSIDQIPLTWRIEAVLMIIQVGYYPILAIVGVPVNIVTIHVLFYKDCGLSPCVRRYLGAMAVADQLVMILDLILRHIPIVYQEQFYFLVPIPVCNIHAVLLYAATDCSVWFTVTFTFDRFVAICCQKLKSKYCSEKTAAVVLGTVTVLSCLKNIFWYFMLTAHYRLGNTPWFCDGSIGVSDSHVWATIEFLHHILTPALPFLLILLLNVFTVRHILVTSRARRRLRAHTNGNGQCDTEMRNRKKSIILLYVISANFSLLWSTLMVYSIWNRLFNLGYDSVYLYQFVQELGFMLQLLSCCTNTAIYAMTQTKFRQQLKNVLKYPFTQIHQSIKFAH
ncbi:probable G-protein coupled receptor 139 [Stegostoma tigrinum]|uniref:probable G-protein coupled receptor 139 n=1 Tax=Stegostoma tigrinum TaxID=3053191 RepID=UPI0028702D43|nr:probable G-protein coupled receptor 139 [Stegostoma tigrinum]